MKNSYQIDLEERILSLLEAGPQTIKVLADKTGQSYYSARKCVYDLQDRKIIRLLTYKDRNQVFEIDRESVNKHTIPTLTDLIMSAQNKAYFIIDAVGKEDTMLGTVAAKTLPQYVTKLMMLAYRLNITKDKGKLPVSNELELIRKEMQTALLQAKNTANLYEQILRHPYFWEEEHLSRMAEDIDFDKDTVIAAFNYYNKED